MVFGSDLYYSESLLLRNNTKSNPNNNIILQEQFQTNKKNISKFSMIMVDNDVNKAHRKFPLDVFLICLKFFLWEDVIFLIGFYFI